MTVRSFRTPYLIDGFLPYFWLEIQMNSRDLSDNALLKRMKAFGFAANSRVLVSHWRHQRAPLPVQALPMLCKALELPQADIDRIVTTAMRQAYPDLAHWIKEAA
jgi:hypothetical protein